LRSNLFSGDKEMALLKGSIYKSFKKYERGETSSNLMAIQVGT
jgi:hypothetical protein